MWRWMLVTGLLALVGATEAATLQEIVEAYVDARQTPGIAVALVTPDRVEIAVAGRTGVGAEVNADTLFEIGSVTKVFTGILLADLVAEGRVSLDSTVGELMPTGHELHPAVASITLRELATHTSGLPGLHETFDMLWRVVLQPANPFAGLNSEDIFAAVAALSGEDLATRDDFNYSNLGVALLGRLLEAATGEAYERLLKAGYFCPWV